VYAVLDTVATRASAEISTVSSPANVPPAHAVVHVVQAQHARLEREAHGFGVAVRQEEQFAVEPVQRKQHSVRGAPAPDRPQQIRGHQHQADAQDHHDENG
jgi:hypothetical protein